MKTQPPKAKLGFHKPEVQCFVRKIIPPQMESTGQLSSKLAGLCYSQFFVFSTRSSGGFQVWESPVFFYSRQDNNLHALDDYLTPCATSVFILKAPDIITLTIWTPFRMRTIGSIRLPITFKLSDLLKEKRRDGPI